MKKWKGEKVKGEKMTSAPFKGEKVKKWKGEKMASSPFKSEGGEKV